MNDEQLIAECVTASGCGETAMLLSWIQDMRAEREALKREVESADKRVLSLAQSSNAEARLRDVAERQLEGVKHEVSRLRKILRDNKVAGFYSTLMEPADG